jgi:hypothetical protein
MLKVGPENKTGLRKPEQLRIGSCWTALRSQSPAGSPSSRRARSKQPTPPPRKFDSLLHRSPNKGAAPYLVRLQLHGKICQGLLDFATAVGVLHQQHSTRLLLKNASSQDERLGVWNAGNFLPFWALPKESSYSTALPK